jgi:cyclohexanone monooxygenase
VRSLHGIYTRGFPNLFIIAGLRQGAPTLNYPHMTDEQAAHAAQIVKRMLQYKVKIMEVAQEAEDRWCELIMEKSKANLQYMRECTPSYLNNEGDLQGVGKLVLATAYGGGAFEYLEILRDWRERHLLEDMQLTRE